MSTPAGIGGKGDKNKRGYQSLNINTLFKGKSAETQKTSVQRQHGLQSLGKVPANARRMPPPANLPSLKLENSGNDPAVSIVPSGGSGGWVKKDVSTTAAAAGTEALPDGALPSQQQQLQRPTSSQQQPGNGSSAMSAAAQSLSNGGAAGSTAASSSSASSRSWSSVMQGMSAGRGDLVGQDSPRFQRDFPTLGDDVAGAGASEISRRADVHGLNLRPQNVGSWREGGGGGRSTGASGASLSDGSLTSDVPEARRRDGTGEDIRDNSLNRAGGSRASLPGVADQRFRTSALKDEQLKKDDSFGKTESSDGGWASITGEVDYSAKLNFSDDEDEAAAKPSSSIGGAVGRSDESRKQSAPPAAKTRPSETQSSRADRSSNEQLSSRDQQSRDRERDRDQHVGNGPQRDSWVSHGPLPQQSHHLPPGPPGPGGYPVSGSVVSSYDMWQRMPPGGPYPGVRPPFPGPVQRYSAIMQPPFGGQRFVPPGTTRPNDLVDDGENWRSQRRHEETNRVIERGRLKREEAERAAAGSSSGGGSSPGTADATTTKEDGEASSRDKHTDADGDGALTRKGAPPRFQQPGGSPPPRAHPPGAGPAAVLMQRPPFWHLFPSPMMHPSMLRGAKGPEGASDAHGVPRGPPGPAGSGPGPSMEYPMEYVEMFFKWMAMQGVRPPAPGPVLPDQAAPLPSEDKRVVIGSGNSVDSDVQQQQSRGGARRDADSLPQHGSSGPAVDKQPQSRQAAAEHTSGEHDKESVISARSERRASHRSNEGGVAKSEKGVGHASRESASEECRSDHLQDTASGREDRGYRRNRRQQQQSRQQLSPQPSGTIQNSSEFDHPAVQQSTSRKRSDAPPPISREAQQKNNAEVRSGMVTLKRKSAAQVTPSAPLAGGSGPATSTGDRKTESPKLGTAQAAAATQQRPAGESAQPPPQLKQAWQKIEQPPPADIKKELQLREKNAVAESKQEAERPPSTSAALTDASGQASGGQATAAPVVGTELGAAATSVHPTKTSNAASTSVMTTSVEEKPPVKKPREDSQYPSDYQDRSGRPADYRHSRGREFVRGARRPTERGGRGQYGGTGRTRGAHYFDNVDGPKMAVPRHTDAGDDAYRREQRRGPVPTGPTASSLSDGASAIAKPSEVQSHPQSRPQSRQAPFDGQTTMTAASVVERAAAAVPEGSAAAPGAPDTDAKCLADSGKAGRSTPTTLSVAAATTSTVTAASAVASAVTATTGPPAAVPSVLKEENVWQRRQQEHERADRNRQSQYVTSQDFYDVGSNRRRGGRGGRGAGASSYRRSARPQEQWRDGDEGVSGERDRDANGNSTLSARSDARPELQASDRRSSRRADGRTVQDRDGSSETANEQLAGTREHGDRPPRRNDGRRRGSGGYDIRESRGGSRRTNDYEHEHSKPGPTGEALPSAAPAPMQFGADQNQQSEQGGGRKQQETGAVESVFYSEGRRHHSSGRRRGGVEGGVSPRVSSVGVDRHGVWTESGRGVYYPLRHRSGHVMRGRGGSRGGRDRSRVGDQYPSATSPKNSSSAGAAPASSTAPKRSSVRRDSATDNTVASTVVATATAAPSGEQEEWETASESSEHFREGKKESVASGNVASAESGPAAAATLTGMSKRASSGAGQLDRRSDGNRKGAASDGGGSKRSPTKHKSSLAAKVADSSFGSRSRRVVEPPHPKVEKERKSDISKFDFNNIAGVVVIDDQNSKAATDDDGWQDEEGFQEVTSKKKLKQKYQEAAAAAHALEVAQQQHRRKKSEAATAARAVATAAAAAAAATAGPLQDSSHQRSDGMQKGHVTAGPSSTRGITGASSAVGSEPRLSRNSQLPPRLARQREEKMKRTQATQLAATSAAGGSTDLLKIDHWPSDGPAGAAAAGQLPRAAVSAPPAQPENAPGSAAVAPAAMSLPKSDASNSVDLTVSSAIGNNAVSSAALPLPVSSADASAAASSSTGRTAVDTVLAGVATVAKSARGPVMSRSSSDRKLGSGASTNVPVQLPAFAGMESSDPRIKFAFDIDSARVADSEERAAAAAAEAAAAAASDVVAASVPTTALAGNGKPAGSVPDLSQKIDSVKTLWDAPSSGTSGSSSGVVASAVASASGADPAAVLSSMLESPFSGTSSTSPAPAAPAREPVGTTVQTTFSQSPANASGSASATAATGAEQTNICMVKPQPAGSAASVAVATSSSGNDKDVSSATSSSAGLTAATSGVAAIAGNFPHGSFRAQDLGYGFNVPHVHAASSTTVGGTLQQAQQQLESLGTPMVTTPTPNRDVALMESFPVATAAGPVPTSSNDQLFHRLAPGSNPYPMIGQRHAPTMAPGSVPLQPKHPFEYPFSPFAPLPAKGLVSYDQNAASGAPGSIVQPSPLYMHFDPSNTGAIADLQAVRSSAGSMLPVQSMGGAGSTAGSPQPTGQPYALSMRVHAAAGGGIYGPVQPGGQQQQQAPTPAAGLQPATTFYQQQAPLSFAMFPTGSQPMPLAMPLTNLNNQTPFGTAVASGGSAIGGLMSNWPPAPSPGGTKIKTPMPTGAFPMNGPPASLAASPYIGADVPQATQWNIGPDKMPVHRRQPQQQQPLQGFGPLTSQQQHGAYTQPTTYGGQQSQPGFGQQQPPTTFGQQSLLLQPQMGTVSGQQQPQQQSQQQQQQQPQAQHRHTGSGNANFVKQHLMSGGVRPTGPRQGFVPRSSANSSHASSSAAYQTPIQRPPPAASAPVHVSSNAGGNSGVGSGTGNGAAMNAVPSGRSQHKDRSQSSKSGKNKGAEDAEKAKQRADLLKQTKSFLNPAEARENGNQPLQQLAASQQQQLIQSSQQQLMQPSHQQQPLSASPLSAPNGGDLSVATDSPPSPLDEVPLQAEEPPRSVSPSIAPSAAAGVISSAVIEPVAASVP